MDEKIFCAIQDKRCKYLDVKKFSAPKIKDLSRRQIHIFHLYRSQNLIIQLDQQELQNPLDTV